MDIVILAGGTCDAELRVESGAQFRSEIEIAGHSMLDLVLQAVRPFGSPVVVGGTPGQYPRQAPGGASFVDSVQNGLDQVRTETFLLCTGDLPFLTEDSVRDFLQACDDVSDLQFPIVRLGACQAMFPGLRRTSVRLREGRFTGGNLALMNRDAMRKAVPLLRQAYEARKSPFRLARLLGVGTLARFVCGSIVPATLPVSTLEGVVGRLLRIQARAIASDRAEIATDIDNAAQLRAARALMNAPKATVR